MEINTQQMEALLQLREQQAQLPRQNTPSGHGFGDLLSRQIDGQNTQANQINPAMAGNAQATLYSQMLLNATDASQTADPDTEVLMAAFDQASGALDMWDAYARTLGTSTTDTALRDAYALLEGIDSRVAQLRANPLAGKNAELDGILNELEIMSATEKFKFNRGDYIS